MEVLALCLDESAVGNSWSRNSQRTHGHRVRQSHKGFSTRKVPHSPCKYRTMQGGIVVQLNLLYLDKHLLLMKIIARHVYFEGFTSLIQPPIFAQTLTLSAKRFKTLSRQPFVIPF